MKILFCLNNDLMSNIAFNLLLDAVKNHDVCVFLSSQVGTPKKRIQELTYCEHDFPFNTLFPSLETQSAALDYAPDRYLSFKEIERFHDIPFHFVTDVNSEEGLTFVRSLAPDVVVSIRYGQIFQEPFISIPPLGILNLHSGPIPDYRGILASFWGMLHGETSLGATLHWIDSSRIDAGPIIARSSFDVDKTKSLLWHVYHLYDVSIPLLIDAIERLAIGGTLPSTREEEPESWPYFSYPDPEDVQRFYDKGYILVNDDEYDVLMQRYHV